MGGLDILIFTGGIGENADVTRSGILKDMEFLSLMIDQKKNKGLRGKEQIISQDGAPVTIMVSSNNLWAFMMVTQVLLMETSSFYC